MLSREAGAMAEVAQEQKPWYGKCRSPQALFPPRRGAHGALSSAPQLCLPEMEPPR